MDKKKFSSRIYLEMKATKTVIMGVKHLPVIVTLSCLWLTLVVCFVAILVINSGHMTYTLDDIYIHMSISRNLNEYSVFGVTRYEFSSSSSSPIWNLVISAAFLLVGVTDMVPLLLNVILASVAVVVVYGFLKDRDMSQRYITAILLSFVFFTPIPGLVFTGMEHIFHIILSLIFVVLSSRVLTAEDSPSRQFMLLFVVTFFASAIRIESVFLVLPVALLFFLKRRWAPGIIVLYMAAVPWIVYGLVSIQNGWLLLPNSLLVKSIDALGIGVSWYLIRSIVSLLISPHLIVLLCAAIYLRRYQGFWHIENITNFIFVISCLIHLLLGNVGSFFRYEAYLVALGIFIVSIQGHRFFSELNLPSLRDRKIDFSFDRKHLYGLGIIALFLAPLAGRGALCIFWTPVASNNIYSQQYQMALFLDRFYTGDVILMNDIGYANYLTDIICIDKWGLGTLDAGLFLINGTMSEDNLEFIAEEHGVKVAILYLDQYIPDDWEIVGYWTIRNNVVVYNSTVAFIAVLPSEKERLINSLIQFSSFLPDTVIESGPYTM